MGLTDKQQQTATEWLITYGATPKTHGIPLNLEEADLINRSRDLNVIIFTRNGIQLRRKVLKALKAIK